MLFIKEIGNAGLNQAKEKWYMLVGITTKVIGSKIWNKGRAQCFGKMFVKSTKESGKVICNGDLELIFGNKIEGIINYWEIGMSGILSVECVMDLVHFSIQTGVNMRENGSIILNMVLVLLHLKMEANIEGLFKMIECAINH